MGVSRRQFLGTSAFALAPAFGIPFGVAAQDTDLEKRIKTAVQAPLKQRFPELAGKPITLQHLPFDQRAYTAFIDGWPESAHELARAYVAEAHRVWHGFLQVGGKEFVGYFKPVKGDDEFLRTFEPIDAGEKDFIAIMRSWADLKRLPAPAVGKDVESRLNDADHLAQLIAKAQGDKTYGGRVDDKLIESLHQALKAAGQEKPGFIRAMSVMDSTELVLAMNLLPLMNHGNYCFKAVGEKTHAMHDLRTQPWDFFYEDVHVAAEVLKTYDWARAEAQLNWNNFMRGIVMPRFTNEFNGGGRMRLFKAMRPLLKDCATLDQAVERFAGSAFKLFRYNLPTGPSDASWPSVIASGGDRCEAMSMMGVLLMRAAGIPSYEARTPWWADGNDNHAWNWVFASQKDGMKYFSFLAGDNERHDGKLNIHVYDKLDPRPGTFFENAWHKGVPRMAKLYVGSPQGNLADITHLCTTTRTLEREVEARRQGDEIALSVYNLGTWRPVAVTKVGEKGKVVFERVGCVPKTWEREGKDGKLGDGLLYAITSSDGKEVVGQPFILTPSKLTPVTPYDGQLRAVIAFPDFPKNKEFEVKVWGKGWERLGTSKSDDQGVLRVPVDDNWLILPCSEKVRVNDIPPFEHPGARPYIVRKTSQGFELFQH